MIIFASVYTFILSLIFIASFVWTTILPFFMPHLLNFSLNVGILDIFLTAFTIILGVSILKHKKWSFYAAIIAHSIVVLYSVYAIIFDSGLIYPFLLILGGLVIFGLVKNKAFFLNTVQAEQVQDVRNINITQRSNTPTPPNNPTIPH